MTTKEIEVRLEKLEALHTDALAKQMIRLRLGQKEVWAVILAVCKRTGRLCVRYPNGELDLVARPTAKPG